MKAIHPLKAGFTLGLLIGAWHLSWVILVAIGWAQAVIDFVFWMHFIKPVYVIAPFNLANAVILVVVTFAGGFIIAWVFSLIWNRLHLN